MKEREIGEVLDKFPYPIASLLKVTYAIDSSLEPAKKLNSILHTAEGIARFLGIIAICEIVKARDQGKETAIPPGLSGSFTYHFKVPGFGNWISFAREGFKYLKENNVEMVIEDFKNLFYENNRETRFKKAIDELISMRNVFEHSKDKTKLTRSQYLEISRIALEFLNQLVADLHFLSSISFGFISSIELIKSKRKNPMYIYKGKKLQGHDFIKEATQLLSREKYQYFKETNAIILKYEEKNDYLNLFPLYIYNENYGDAVDIFYYNGIKRNKINYIGCGYGGQFTVSSNSNAGKSAEINNWRSVINRADAVYNLTADRLDSVKNIENELEYILKVFT